MLLLLLLCPSFDSVRGMGMGVLAVKVMMVMMLRAMKLMRMVVVMMMRLLLGMMRMTQVLLSVIPSPSSP